MQLSSSGISVGLKGWETATLLSAMGWDFMPLVVAIVNLGVKMIFALKVIGIANCKRVDTEDTKYLLKDKVLSMTLE
jgi:hypothetical protein